MPDERAGIRELLAPSVSEQIRSDSLITTTSMVVAMDRILQAKGIYEEDELNTTHEEVLEELVQKQIDKAVDELIEAGETVESLNAQIKAAEQMRATMSKIIGDQRHGASQQPDVVRDPGQKLDGESASTPPPSGGRDPGGSS